MISEIRRETRESEREQDKKERTRERKEMAGRRCNGEQQVEIGQYVIIKDDE